MSDITPYSHHDDFHSLSSRLPRSPSSSIVTTTTASTYTGSYFDDGLDLVPPIQGIGATNTSFYMPPTQPRAQSAWNATIAQAVSGDIRCSLARIQGAGKLAVVCSDKEKENGRGWDVVRVPAPRQWGTFVIKGEDGVVVVVGPDGEFEAVGQGGPFEERQGWVRGKDTRRRRQGSGASGRKREEPQKTGPVGGWRDEGKREHGKCDDSQHGRQTARKLLTPIMESEKDEIGSPTRFFMSGGAGSLPSPSAASVATPSSRTASSLTKPMVPHAITWDTSPVASIEAWSEAVPVLGLDTWSKEEERSWDGTRIDEWGERSRGGSIKSSSTHRRPTVEKAADGSPTWQETYSIGEQVGDSGVGGVKRWGQDEESKSGSTRDGPSWDGFERAKSRSEASAAGSNPSEGSWAGSQATSGHGHGRQHRRFDASRHGSLGSGASSRRQGRDEWGGGGEQSDDGWASKRGSDKSWADESKGGNEISGDWGGTRTRVRITSRRGSGGGEWE
jgi:hypothetical protein